jgi:TatD DNase family protein
LDLAVVLHAPHETAARALSLLRAERIKRAVFHWHKASPEVTRAIVEEGFYISVTPETCYRQRDQELVDTVPLSSLVIETDGPWPYSGEFEGRSTEPAFLGRIVDAIATIKGVAREEVAEIVTVNTRRLFRLP